MKRIDLIKTLEKMDCVLIRHGGKHDWYQNPDTKMSQPIPRHREIKESLAKHIIKMLS
jgi:mRNA interferase HicA